MDDANLLLTAINDTKVIAERLEHRMERLEDKFDRKIEQRDFQCKSDREEIQKEIKRNSVSIAKLVGLLAASTTIGAGISKIF